MIHKQQLGHNQSDIAKGLCDALVRNYLNNVGKGKGFTNFKGTSIHNIDYKVNGFECNGCSNVCEVIEIRENERLLARYGDKYGKRSNLGGNKDSKLA
jgi:hypothetical protein